MPRGAKKAARGGGSGRGGGGPAAPIGKGVAGHPRKKFYRARAHANPLSDGFFVDLPDSPGDMDWGSLFPVAAAAAQEKGLPPPSPTVADVGCGFGGLLISLAPLLPSSLMVGIELRDSVCDYVRQRVAVLRGGTPPACDNVAAVRVNAQRHLTHLFGRASLDKLFFLFPVSVGRVGGEHGRNKQRLVTTKNDSHTHTQQDPHFKAKNFRRRIVTPALASEYAYVLRAGGRLYTATDVGGLAEWMATSLGAHPAFRRLSEAECAADPAVGLLTSATEEAQKVARNGGKTWVHCYEKV